jgi:hypothetical protein
MTAMANRSSHRWSNSSKRTSRCKEENHRLTQQKEDERFTPTDTARHVAVTQVGMFSPDKVRDIIRRAEALLKQRNSGVTKTPVEKRRKHDTLSGH